MGGRGEKQWRLQKCQPLPTVLSRIVGSGDENDRRARTFTHALTECLNEREQRSTSGHCAGASYETNHPAISVRAIASFWTQLAPCCFQIPTSRYGIEGEICRPLNHMWQISLPLTAPDRPCLFNIHIWWEPVSCFSSCLVHAQKEFWVILPFCDKGRSPVSFV